MRELANVRVEVLFGKGAAERLASVRCLLDMADGPTTGRGLGQRWLYKTFGLGCRDCLGDELFKNSTFMIRITISRRLVGTVQLTGHPPEPNVNVPGESIRSQPSNLIQQFEFLATISCTGQADAHVINQ